jgi:hypothetical protein
MKAILEFDLNDPDDMRNHLRCIKATDMALALWHIRMMRRELEWMEDQKELTTENVMSKIFEFLDDNNVNTDELTS